MVARFRDDSYFGERVRSWRAAGLLLSERTYPPCLRLPAHAHERPYFCAVLQGGYTERCGGKEWECAPQTLFLRPSGEVHADRFGEKGGRVFGIELEADWPIRTDALSRALGRPASLGGACLGLVLKLYREFRTDDPASPLMVQGLVLEMLGETCRFSAQAEHSGLPGWLRKAHDLLRQQYRNPPHLTQMADEVGVHPVHLARMFRRRFGCTVGEYVRRLRIEFACRELMIPGRSFVEVALTAGYCDQSQFCRAFKRQLGITPSQFCRQMRGR